LNREQNKIFKILITVGKTRILVPRGNSGFWKMGKSTLKLEVVSGKAAINLRRGNETSHVMIAEHKRSSRRERETSGAWIAPRPCSTTQPRGKQTQRGSNG